MDRVWITTGSTSVAPVANPIAAACHDGYVPTDVYILDNPTVADVTESVESMIKTIITAHGGDEPTVSVHTIEEELDLEAIASYLRSTIDAARASDARVAIDVTPGRKFWSIISFRAGMELDVDHLYYVLLEQTYFGDIYPDIPRSAIDLIDFTEVI